MPLTFALGRNYPNPFNPVTTIRYELPVREHLRLLVYSVLGQVVATLMDGQVEAGYHAARFDASALPSGVYFYRISAGSFTDVKKMSLVK